MTRIIAGTAGGTVLRVPEAGTRPTSDRVRESLFAALDAADAIHDTRVLDLFAGSGALGLEALSRGAKSADLVEKNRAAAQVTQRNAEVLQRGLRGVRTHVHNTDAARYLTRNSAIWDLVFIDPPYDFDNETLTELLGLLAPRLSPEAIVIVERATRSGEPASDSAVLECTREKRYGDTTLWWLQPTPPDQSA